MPKFENFAAIEGGDGSGKNEQTIKIHEYLAHDLISDLPMMFLQILEPYHLQLIDLLQNRL
jgi:thymidylate kinase